MNRPSPCTWRNSSIRSAERVTRSAPQGWNPALSPVSAGSTSRYRRTEAARIAMIVGWCAKWVQSPAACQVEPAVSSFFSRSTTSRQPRAVRRQASETPMTPPPTITACVSVAIEGGRRSSEPSRVARRPSTPGSTASATTGAVPGRPESIPVFLNSPVKLRSWAGPRDDRKSPGSRRRRGAGLRLHHGRRARGRKYQSLPMNEVFGQNDERMVRRPTP